MERNIKRMCITLLYTINEQNTVNQLHFILKKKKKLRIISRISHLIFLRYGSLQITKTMKSESMDKGTVLCFILFRHSGSSGNRPGFLSPAHPILLASLVQH